MCTHSLRQLPRRCPNGTAMARWDGYHSTYSRKHRHNRLRSPPGSKVASCVPPDDWCNDRVLNCPPGACKIGKGCTR